MFMAHTYTISSTVPMLEQVPQVSIISLYPQPHQKGEVISTDTSSANQTPRVGSQEIISNSNEDHNIIIYY